jgi:hypothetical protein
MSPVGAAAVARSAILGLAPSSGTSFRGCLWVLSALVSPCNVNDDKSVNITAVKMIQRLGRSRSLLAGLDNKAAAEMPEAYQLLQWVQW